MIEQVACKCGSKVALEIPEDLRPEWQESLRRVGGVCNDCSAQARQVESVNLQRQAVFSAEKRAASSGIPRRLRGLDWERLDVDAGNRDALAQARRWAQRGRPGLVLTGEVGTGKTTIAAAAAWDFLGRGRLRWTSMPAAFVQLSNRDDKQGQKIARELMLGSTALVLDDLDKARPTEYGAEVVFGVIDNRLTQDAPLLVTMNLDYVQLAKKFPEPYGEAIASRLVEYCGPALEVRGRDRRIPAPAEPVVLPGIGEAA